MTLLYLFVKALWRGYSWRKKNDRTEIKAIRRSLRAVSKNVEEENKLYRRTERALHYLLTYKHLSAILEALKHLGSFPVAMSCLRVGLYFP